MMSNQGFLAGLLAACCFAFMNVIVQANATLFDPALIVLARGVVGVIIFFPKARKEIGYLFCKESLFLWSRFLAGSISLFALFCNIQQSGSAAGMALAKTEVVFVLLLSILVFKAWPRRMEWVGILCMVSGVYIVYFPKLLDIEPRALFLGLVGAFFGGIALISLKKIAQKFSPFLTVWGLCLTYVGTSFLLPQTREWQVLDLNGVVSLFMVGLLGGVGQVLLTKSYGLLSAPVASVVNLSSILWCLVLESAIFHLYPDLPSLGGYGLMILGLTCIQAFHLLSTKQAKVKL